MIVPVLNLSGIGLDYAVAQARGYTDLRVFQAGRHNERGWIEVRFNSGHRVPTGRYDPSINPEFSWPIIDEGGITVGPWDTSPAMAHYGLPDTISSHNPRIVGATKLEAAMRCYLFRIYGQLVDVPESTMTPGKPEPALELPEDEHGKFWYVRTNVETGAETRECFTPIQSPVFGDAKGVSRAALLQAMESCLKTWNRQMPNQYRYRLAPAIPTLTERA